MPLASRRVVRCERREIIQGISVSLDHFYFYLHLHPPIFLVSRCFFFGAPACSRRAAHARVPSPPTAHLGPLGLVGRWACWLLVATCSCGPMSYELRRNLGTKWHVRGPVDFVEHRTDNGQRQEPGVLIHGSNN